MSVAYFMSKFPSISTTFIQRELHQLEKNDFIPLIISNHKPKQNEVHPDDIKFIDKCIYLDKIKKTIYIISFLKSFVKNPFIVFVIIYYSLKYNDDFPFQRIKNLAHCLIGFTVADICKKNNIDHLHVHFAYGAAAIAMFASKISKITYSISIHGSDVLLKRPLTKYKLAHAKFIISNCKFHISNLTTKFPILKEKKFHLIPIGIDLETKEWSICKELSSKNVLNILNVGRLHPVKSQDVLIKACALLKQKGIPFMCKIVGGGDEKEKLQQLIDSLNLRSNVELTGEKFEKDIIKYYEWAHITVLSSKSEGTPMTLIESMAKGRPVIAPEITAIPELIESGKQGYMFNSQDEYDLANKIELMFEEFDLLESKGIIGRKHVEENNNIRINVLKIKKVFEENYL